jgi:hypothetical protein
MLSLEGAALQIARKTYFGYVADAPLERSEPIEGDEQAQAEIAGDLSEVLDERRYEISEDEASFSFVCSCFHALYGPGLDLFAALASPVVETFDACDQLNQLISYAMVELAAHEIGG